MFVIFVEEITQILPTKNSKVIERPYTASAYKNKPAAFSMFTSKLYKRQWKNATSEHFLFGPSRTGTPPHTNRSAEKNAQYQWRSLDGDTIIATVCFVFSHRMPLTQPPLISSWVHWMRITTESWPSWSSGSLLAMWQTNMAAFSQWRNVSECHPKNEDNHLNFTLWLSDVIIT